MGSGALWAGRVVLVALVALDGWATALDPRGLQGLSPITDQGCSSVSRVSCAFAWGSFLGGNERRGFLRHSRSKVQPSKVHSGGAGFRPVNWGPGAGTGLASQGGRLISHSLLRMSEFDSPFPPQASDGRWKTLTKVFVLLFNPRSDNEGIYTLQLPGQSDTPDNTVVLFEGEDDAQRFAGLLEAQDFPTPHVEALEPEVIEQFTSDSGYKAAFIPVGTLFLPPEKNLDRKDMLWQEDGEYEKEDIDYDQARRRLESLFGS